MQISVTLIYDYLKKIYKNARMNACSQASIRSFRIYENSTLTHNALYVMHVSDIAYLSTRNKGCIYLIIGTMEEQIVEEWMRSNQETDVIFLQEDVELTVITNLLNDMFDYYDIWEETMSNCPRSKAGLQAMIDASDKVLGGAIILSDYRFNYLAYSRSWNYEVSMIQKQSHGRIPQYILDEMLTDPEYIKVKNSTDIFEYQIHRHNSLVTAYCGNLFDKHETEYTARLLFVPDEYPVTEAQLELLKIFRVKINQLYNQISNAELPFFSQDELRATILGGIQKEPVSQTILGSVLKNYGWDLHDDYTLLIFTPFFFDNVREVNANIQVELERRIPHCCSVIYEKNIVVVVNMAEVGAIDVLKTSEFATFLREHLYKMSISSKISDFSMLHQAYLQASIALKQGNRRDSTFWYYNFSDYALFYLIEECQTEISGDNLISEGLKRILEYDRGHDTDYAKTLYQYMRCRYNMTHTADALYIHRTTLMKRLEKISEISHLNLEDWNTRLYLAISYQMIY